MIEEKVIKAYKAFDKNMQCRGFQYEVGQEYELDGDVKLDKCGFHACESPMELWQHCDLSISRFAEVELFGKIDKAVNSTNVCSSKIKIKAELKLADIIRAGMDWLKAKGIDDWNDNGLRSAQIASCEDYSWIGSSGGNAKIGSIGEFAQIGSSGDKAKIASCGYTAFIGSSGRLVEVFSSGDYAQIASSGDYAKIESTGESSVIMCVGNDSIAKAKVGSWITLVEWMWSGEKYRLVPKCVKSEYVDGERIKADTWYKIVNGEFVEVTE